MKSVVNKNEPNKLKPFPKLMILKSTGSIILATHNKGSRPSGTLLTKASCNDIGDVTDWASDFVDFEGSVTLSND